MSFHRNAKLGLAGRYALVCAVEGGMSLKAVAGATGFCHSTVGSTPGPVRVRPRTS